MNGTWYLKKFVTISEAHHLRDYVGKCANQHGHNWKIIVHCRGKELDKAGMVIDFGDIKTACMKYDHKDMNTFPEFSEPDGVNPTAENLAKILFQAINKT